MDDIIEQLKAIETTRSTFLSWLKAKSDDDIVAQAGSTEACLVGTFFTEQLEALGLDNLVIGCGYRAYSIYDAGSSPRTLVQEDTPHHLSPLPTQFDDAALRLPRGTELTKRGVLDLMPDLKEELDTLA
jgi:hypothetical protein